MSRCVQNRNQRRANQREHALERLRERHSPDATMLELEQLERVAADVVACWNHKARVSYGAVVSYEGADSVVVRLLWRTPSRWINVVYSPVWSCMRTVLPSPPLPAWKQALLDFEESERTAQLQEQTA